MRSALVARVGARHIDHRYRQRAVGDRAAREAEERGIADETRDEHRACGGGGGGWVGRAE